MNNKSTKIAFASLVLMAVMILVLWKPWVKKGISSDAKLQIYCAAGLRKAVDEIVADYEKEYKVKISVDSGPSGALMGRVDKVNGTVGDLFLPADTWYVNELKAKNFIAEKFAVGYFQPVIAVSKGNPKDIRNLQDLFREGLKVGLGNPEASIGRSTQQVMEPMKLWAKVIDLSKEKSRRFTFMGKVTEVALHVKKKTIDAGIVWKATAIHNGLEIIEIEELTANKQPIVLGVLKKSKNPTAALQFARYLTARDKGLLSFKKHSFQPIEDGDIWDEDPRIPIMYGSMLTPGLRKAIDAFKKREGVDFQEIANGCGKLVAQMTNKNTPFVPEAYVSCHETFMDDVEGLFEPRVDLSKNFLVMVVPKGNPRNIKTLDDLAQDKLRIGLGHHTHSAMGNLTMKLLQKNNLYEKIKNGGNMREYDSGHALTNIFLAPRSAALDVIIVYRSNVQSTPSNLEKCELIDLKMSEAVASQPYAIKKNGKHSHLMKRLFEMVTSAKNQEEFIKAGFAWEFKDN